MKYEWIAEASSVSKSFISKWKKIFKAVGKEGLKLCYQGSKSYLTSPEKEDTLSWLKEQEYWDLSELECYLIERYDVVFKSKTSYYSLLEEAQISWQKAQKSNPGKNPEEVEKKNQEIRLLLEHFQSKIKAGKLAVYAIDEVHLLEGDIISHLWGDSKKRLNITLKNEKNRQTYYGAYDLLNPELIVHPYPRGNGDCTVEFVRELIKINKDKQILIFEDGASYHRGQIMRDFLEEIKVLPLRLWQLDTK